MKRKWLALMVLALPLRLFGATVSVQSALSMKGAIGKNACYFNTHRMMRQYVTDAYIQ